MLKSIVGIFILVAVVVLAYRLVTKLYNKWDV